MRADAPLQQADDLAGEAGKVYQDALVGLEALEVVLSDFQGVQEVGVILTGSMDPQHLQQDRMLLTACCVLECG